jgi:lysozyme
MNVPKTVFVLAIGIVAAILIIRLARHVKMARYAVHGIDVSHYQQEVDWPLVQTECDFVFLKATEGTGLADKYFRKHWQTLGRLKLKRGAYHFFLPAADARLQADHFIRHVPLKPGDLPPVLDVELAGDVSSREITKGVGLWLKRVEAHYRVRPILYTNASFYRQHLQGKVAGYPIWIAQYGWRTPETEPAWHFWQYSDAGRMKGVGGKVDMNVFSGSPDELNRLCMP